MLGAVTLVTSVSHVPHVSSHVSWSAFSGHVRRAGLGTGHAIDSSRRLIHVVIDQLYAQLTSTRLNAKFFESGFGFETGTGAGHLPSFHDSVGEMRDLVCGRYGARVGRVGDAGEQCGPQSGFPIELTKRLDVPAAAARIYEGWFETPVASTYKLLPYESRRAHVQYVVPYGGDGGDEIRFGAARGIAGTRTTANSMESTRSGLDFREYTPRSTVVHLAATGDHGYSRRLLAYALPLARQHNIASVILESPFYGIRKPSYQNRSKLKRLSDLLLLGKATIEESLYVLRWLDGIGQGQRNVISGVSMGGVHACMVASMYSRFAGEGALGGVGEERSEGGNEGGPGEHHERNRGVVGVVPLLAPRSASEAYCRGALRVGTSWDGLQVCTV